MVKLKCLGNSGHVNKFNDIFKKLRKANCDPVILTGEDKINALAYADDILLLSPTAEGLQKALDTVQ